MSSVSLNSFPQNNCEALALLYLQNQDLSQKTPEQICEMYWDAYFRIRQCNFNAKESASIK